MTRAWGEGACASGGPRSGASGPLGPESRAPGLRLAPSATGLADGVGSNHGVRVVIAVDLGASSDEVIRVGAGLVRGGSDLEQPELVLVHVVPTSESQPEAGRVRVVENELDGKSMLRRLGAECLRGGMPRREVVVSGCPSREIAELTQRYGAGLLVLGRPRRIAAGERSGGRARGRTVTALVDTVLCPIVLVGAD